MQKFLGLRGPNYIRKRQQRLTAQGKLFQLGWEGSPSQAKDSGKSFSAGAEPSENLSKSLLITSLYGNSIVFSSVYFRTFYLFRSRSSPSFQAISNNK